MAAAIRLLLLGLYLMVGFVELVEVGGLAAMQVPWQLADEAVRFAWRSN